MNASVRARAVDQVVVPSRRAIPEHRSATIAMRAMAVDFPEVSGHPNRLPFEGCLTLVDTPSDRAPSGARGHRVVLTRAAAESALPSLLGMAVDFKAGWDGHDARQKCGIITAAHLEDRRLMVAGFLFARDFPEMEPALAGSASIAAMGMSYELADAHVADMRAAVWTLTRALSPAQPSCCARKQPIAEPASTCAAASSPGIARWLRGLSLTRVPKHKKRLDS